MSKTSILVSLLLGFVLWMNVYDGFSVIVLLDLTKHQSPWYSTTRICFPERSHLGVNIIWILFFGFAISYVLGSFRTTLNIFKDKD